MKQQNVPAYMVTLNQIVETISTIFKLDIDMGYTWFTVGKPRKGDLCVIVTAPEWGSHSQFTFYITRNPETHLWCPTPDVLASLELADHWKLDPEHRNKRYHVQLQRTSSDDRTGYGGPYPRYEVVNKTFVSHLTRPRIGK
jgi:hypothetical protein